MAFVTTLILYFLCIMYFLNLIGYLEVRDLNSADIDKPGNCPVCRENLAVQVSTGKQRSLYLNSRPSSGF
jgi:hypothetical protein